MTTEKDIFKEKGVGSITWYLKAIKIHPDNGGINFLTKYKGIDWYSADNAVRTMTYRGYLKENTKPPKKRVNYELTSFGHRYLEEHKADIEGLEILPGGDKLSTGGSIPAVSGKVGAVEVGKVHSVAEAPVFKPSVPEPAGKEPVALDKPRPLDRVVDSAITLGQEIEKHKTSAVIAQDVEKSDSTPDVIQEPVENTLLDEPLVDLDPQADPRVQELPEWARDNICISEHGILATWKCINEQHMLQTKEFYFSPEGQKARSFAISDPEVNTPPDPVLNPGTGAPVTLTDQFKSVLGQLMVEKFADQVTAKEILEFMEKTDHE